MNRLKTLDLFSGVGGFSLGLERTGGFRTVAFCETDPYARRVLAKHWPEVPILGDVTTAEFPAADVICAGFPCQGFSNAGKRAGLSDSRSGLFWELVRAIRVVRPRYVLLENVAALLGRGMGDVLGGLAESGYDAEWDCVPACAIGAPHERDRVWIVAHAPSADDRQCHAGAAERQASQPRDSTSSMVVAHATSIGSGEGRQGRPPDSFARVRDGARRNAADPYGARLAFGESIETDTRAQLSAAERTAFVDVWQSQWQSEPSVCRVDDGIPSRLVQEGLSYAETQIRRPDQALSALQRLDGKEPLLGTAGRHGAIQETEVLRRGVHGVGANESGTHKVGNTQAPCNISKNCLRDMRGEQAPVSSSQGPKLDELRGDKPSDALFAVSHHTAPSTRRPSLDAGYWSAGWPEIEALLTDAEVVPDRMDRVRCLGNSLIPKIPELIGRAILEAAP